MQPKHTTKSNLVQINKRMQHSSVRPNTHNPRPDILIDPPTEIPPWLSTLTKIFLGTILGIFLGYSWAFHHIGITIEGS